MTIRKCLGKVMGTGCGVARCLRVWVPGERSAGYHVRYIPRAAEREVSFLQVCPNICVDVDRVTASTDKATPEEVRAVMVALQAPEAAGLLAWLTEGSAPQTADPERR